MVEKALLEALEQNFIIFLPTLSWFAWLWPLAFFSSPAAICLSTSSRVSSKWFNWVWGCAKSGCCNWGSIWRRLPMKYKNVDQPINQTRVPMALKWLFRLIELALVGVAVFVSLFLFFVSLVIFSAELSSSVESGYFFVNFFYFLLFWAILWPSTTFLWLWAWE